MLVAVIGVLVVVAGLADTVSPVVEISRREVIVASVVTIVKSVRSVLEAVDCPASAPAPP